MSYHNDWTSPSQNGYSSLSTSYSYGYGGSRNDLPAAGYNRDYSAASSSSWGNSDPVYPASFQQQGYNPVYPTYDSSRNEYTQHVYTSSSQGYQGAFTRSRDGGFLNSVAFDKGNSGRSKPTTSIVAIDKTRLKKKIAVVPAKPVKKISSGAKFKVTPVAKTTISKQKNTKVGVDTSPVQPVKVARVKRNAGNQKGVAKMPNYQGFVKSGGWGAPWTGTSAQGATNGNNGGGGRGRGGFRGRGRGGFRGNRGAPKPQNKKDDIPFEQLPESAPQINLTVSADNIVAFHGFDSVFTTQHNFPVLIDGHIYESCDHYYQIRKVADLCATPSEKLNASVRDKNGVRSDGKKAPQSHESKSFSFLAREAIKNNSVDKAKVEEWRLTKGLEAVQKVMMAKVSQSAHLREALKETGDAILVHAYAGDSIYGTGCTVPKVKKWLEELEKAGVKNLNIPSTFPLTVESVKTVPAFADGRNILGVILMQLRQMVSQNKIEIVDMSGVFSALRNTDTDVIMASGDNKPGFQIGGNGLNQKVF